MSRLWRVAGWAVVAGFMMCSCAGSPAQPVALTRATKASSRPVASPSPSPVCGQVEVPSTSCIETVGQNGAPVYVLDPGTGVIGATPALTLDPGMIEHVLCWLPDPNGSGQRRYVIPVEDSEWFVSTVAFASADPRVPRCPSV